MRPRNEWTLDAPDLRWLVRTDSLCALPTNIRGAFEGII